MSRAPESELVRPTYRHDGYLNTRQAAKELGIKVCTVYEWTKRGWIAGWEKWGKGKRGGRLRYRKTEFAYIGPHGRMGPIPGNAAGRVAYVADEGDPMNWEV
jgi:hypothetical protein